MPIPVIVAIVLAVLALILGLVALIVALLAAPAKKTLVALHERLDRTNAGLNRVEQRSDEIDRQAKLVEESFSRVKADLDKGQTDVLTRMGDVESKLQGRMGTLDGKVDELRHYLQDVFQDDLKGAMANFDRTVMGVLGEMKDELVQGVGRIESIESAVASRGNVGDLLAADSEKARKLLESAAEPAETEAAEQGEGSAEGTPDPPPAAPADDDTGPVYVADMQHVAQEEDGEEGAVRPFTVIDDGGQPDDGESRAEV